MAVLNDGVSLHALNGVACLPQPSEAMALASPEPDTHGPTVMLDAWFNSQQRKNAAGQTEYFHYKWNDVSDSGFSLLGQIFQSYGIALDTLYSAPTVKNLKRAQYYNIVSPDIPVKNPHPNYDPANADIEHLNLIADRFGIHFNSVLGHHVIGDDLAAGQIAVGGGGPLFHDPHILYMKDTCTISLKAPATSLLEDKGDILMATAKYGKAQWLTS